MINPRVCARSLELPEIFVDVNAACGERNRFAARTVESEPHEGDRDDCRRYENDVDDNDNDDDHDDHDDCCGGAAVFSPTADGAGSGHGPGTPTPNSSALPRSSAPGLTRVCGSVRRPRRAELQRGPAPDFFLKHAVVPARSVVPAWLLAPANPLATWHALILRRGAQRRCHPALVGACAWAATTPPTPDKCRRRRRRRRMLHSRNQRWTLNSTRRFC